MKVPTSSALPRADQPGHDAHQVALLFGDLHAGHEAEGGGLVDERLGDRVGRRSVIEDVAMECGPHAEHRPATGVLERLADAELVALGVDHLDPLRAELGEVPIRHSPSAQAFETSRFRLDVRRREVEVHSVLRRLRLVDPLEQQSRATAVSVAEHRVLSGGACVLIPERGAPERGGALEVGAVQDDFDVHAAILSPVCSRRDRARELR